MDSTTDLIKHKLLQHEGKVRFRLEGMRARYSFLYEALEDYLKSPELAERRVAVYPTEDGGQYVVNTQSGIVMIGEARFTQYVEIYCNSYRSPRGKEVPEPGQPTFIKLTVDDGQKSKRQCIMLSLFDLTPSVIEHFAWLVGYMCERFPDAKLIDDIEDEALRERKKLEIWRPKEDVTTYAPDLRSVFLPPAGNTQTTTPSPEAQVKTADDAENEMTGHSPTKPKTIGEYVFSGTWLDTIQAVLEAKPKTIGEYVFSGTPEEFITVALAEAEVCRPYGLWYEERRKTEIQMGDAGATFLQSRDRHRTEIGFFREEGQPDMSCLITALTRAGGRSTVSVTLHRGDWNHFAPVWDALQAAITKHDYTFTPVDASQETVPATTPEAQENTPPQKRSGRKTLLCNLWAFAETLLGKKPEDIIADWKELYEKETGYKADGALTDPLDSMKQGIKDRSKEYRGMSKN